MQVPPQPINSHHATAGKAMYVLEYRSPTEGGKGGRGGQFSAEGGQYMLADYVRGGQFPLADYVRGDKICGGTESAPTAN